jgi:pyruvate formate lyase activating enzyme
MIEKKPIYHYRPGSKLLSLGTVGCSWSCDFCINHHISQRRENIGKSRSPENVVGLAKHYRCNGIAFTYNEPLIYSEFARDIGTVAHENRLFNVVVTNGYGTPEAVDTLSEFADCIVIGLKGNASKEFLRKHSNVPDVTPIFDTISQLKKKNRIHLEISDLVFPQEGDSLEQAKVLCDWIVREMGPDTPIHFISFHPSYKLESATITSQAIMEKHCNVASEAGLHYSYIANFPGHERENTYCPKCHKAVITRLAYNINAWYLDEDNRCTGCGYKIAIEGRHVDTPYEERYEAVIFPPSDFQYFCEGLVPPSMEQSNVRFEPD